MFEVVSNKFTEWTTKRFRPAGFPDTYDQLRDYDLSLPEHRISVSEYVSVRTCGKKYQSGVSALADYLDSLRRLEVVAAVSFLISQPPDRPTTVVLAVMLPSSSLGARAGQLIGQVEAGHRLFKRCLPPLIDSTLEFVDTSGIEIGPLKRDLADEWSGEQGIEAIIWLPFQNESVPSEELQPEPLTAG